MFQRLALKAGVMMYRAGISYCKLGLLSVFHQQAQILSTAKGLLELYIQKQPFLELSYACKTLMGDRYDKLRLNVFDISENQSILEKAFKELAFGVLVKSCKKIITTGSLGQHLPVLLKIFLLSQSAEEEIVKFKQIVKQERYIPKFNLRELDFSKLENYNRHDLARKVLRTFVYTEFSAVRKFCIANLDVGRAQAYLDAHQAFIDDLKKQTDPIYKNFRPKLNELHVLQQTYRGEIPIQYQLYKTLVFTRIGELYQITKLRLEKNFKQTNKEEALFQIIDETFQDDSVQYTMKEIAFNATAITEDARIHKFFLCHKSVQLELFEFDDDSLQNGICQDFFEFTKTIPLNQFHTLKCLRLNAIQDCDFEIGLFFKAFIYNQKVQLHELKFVDVTVKVEHSSMVELETIIKDLGDDYKIPLTKLEFGKFNSEAGYDEFLQYTYLSRYAKIQQLTLINAPLSQEFLNKCKGYYDDLIKLKIYPRLTYVKFDTLALDKVEQWQMVGEIFIFTKKFQLKELVFSNVTVSPQMYEGLSQAQHQLIDKTIEKKLLKAEAKLGKQLSQEESVEVITDCFKVKINSLTISNSKFTSDILTLFFSNVTCQIQELNVINCTDLALSLKQSKENDIKFQTELINNMDSSMKMDSSSVGMYTFQLEKLNLSQSPIEDAYIFEWFFQYVVFNEKRQQMKQLELKSFKLTGSQLNFIAKQIHRVREYEWKKDLVQYFQLREFNFEDNNDISFDSWVQFYKSVFDSPEIPSNDAASEHNSSPAKSISAIDPSGLKLDAVIEIQKNDQDDESYIENQQQALSKQITSNDLKIWDKIVNNPDQFQVIPHKKLQKIMFSMNFPDNEIDVMYYKTIKSFILFPGCTVQEIIFQQLKLTPFIAQSKIVFKEQIQYLQSISGQIMDEKQFHPDLTSIEIKSLDEQSDQAIIDFIEMYLNNPKLKKLTVCGFKGIFIKQYIQIPKENFQIEELIIDSSTEEFNEEESLNFIKTVFQESKIVNLKICKELKLSIVSVDNLEFSKKISKLDVSFIKENPAWMKSLAPLILPLVEKLEITQNEDPEILQNVKLSTQELTLNYPVIYNQDFYNLIVSTRDSLSLLKIKSFKSIDQNIIKSENQKTFQSCKLHLSGLIDQSADANYIMDNFVFDEMLNFNQVSLASNQCIKQVTQFKQFKNLQYLNINPALLYNSSEQLNENLLKTIGTQYIYNLDSQLETLIFNQCHLKPPGIKALTSGAQPFRDAIAKQEREGSTYLNLKRFEIYYSLYLTDEGGKLVCQDILFFEYITLERLAVPVTNWNDNNQQAMNNAGANWLKFQADHDRKYKKFEIQHFEIGRNEFLEKEQTWNQLMDIFLFTDNSPKLHTLYIHFMSQNDFYVEILSKGINKFLNTKPKNYRLPLKRLNYMLNTALTEIGWRMVSENLFFHQKIDLEELNLISTMLDGPEKLRAIYEPGLAKAKTMPNGKLKLHSLVTFNISLKDKFSDVLSPRPIDYKDTEDIPVSIDFESRRQGLIDGVPEEFGAILQITQKVINNEQYVSQNGKWKNLEQFKFGTYNLSFVDHFIKVINATHNDTYNLYFSALTLDTLASLFKYTDAEPGNPYPINLLLQQAFYEFIKTYECKIWDIVILPSQFNTNEIVNQEHILYIWEQVKHHSTSINQITIDYTLNDDLIDIMFAKGYTERDILQLVRILPPSKVRLQDQVTLSFIKGLYTIFWDSYNFQYSNITYDMDNMLNIGIGYYLREQIYKQDDKTIFGQYFKKFLYYLNSIFVNDAPKYEFKEEVKTLNIFLSKQRFKFTIITIMTLLWYLICLIPPYQFTHNLLGDTGKFKQICISGIDNSALYLYYSFAFLSFLFEAYLCRQIFDLLPSFDKGLDIGIDEADIQQEDDNVKIKPVNVTSANNQVLPLEDEIKQEKKRNQYQSKGTFQEMSTIYKKRLTKIKGALNVYTGSAYGKFLAFSIKIVAAQLEKLNFFQDIQFILACYYCEFQIIFILALFITSFNVAIQLYNFVKVVYQRMTETSKSSKLLSTKFINDFFNVCMIGRNSAISDILDKVAPFNVTVIPNNRISRYFLPRYAGKSINNAMKNYLLKFLFQDAPQLILQVIYVITAVLNPVVSNSTSTTTSSSQSAIGWKIIFTISISSFSLVTSFLRFMAIRPSTLSNSDFDELATKKTQQRSLQINSMLSEEKMIIETYTDHFDDKKSNPSPVGEQAHMEEQLLFRA